MSKQNVLDFIQAINDHSIEKISALVTDDHIFTDAHNNSITGKETIKQGWAGYFKWFPDYKIEIDEFYESDDTFVMFGFASATYRGINPVTNHWKLPAAWKACMENSKIKLWQVYCDTKIPYDIMEKNV